MVERYLDITKDSCPMTFVKAKLELEKLSPDGALEIRLRGAEPLANVPRSATESGFRLESSVPNDDGSHTLVISR